MGRKLFQIGLHGTGQADLGGHVLAHVHGVVGDALNAQGADVLGIVGVLCVRGEGPHVGHGHDEHGAEGHRSGPHADAAQVEGGAVVAAVAVAAAVAADGVQLGREGGEGLFQRRCACARVAASAAGGLLAVGSAAAVGSAVIAGGTVRAIPGVAAASVVGGVAQGVVARAARLGRRAGPAFEAAGGQAESTGAGGASAPLVGGVAMVGSGHGRPSGVLRLGFVFPWVTGSNFPAKSERLTKTLTRTVEIRIKAPRPCGSLVAGGNGTVRRPPLRLY